MGKIRIAKLGDAGKEKAQKEKARVRREQKKVRLGLKPAEKETVKEEKPTTILEKIKEEKTLPKKKVEKPTPVKKLEVGSRPAKRDLAPPEKLAVGLPKHSQRYLQALSLVDRSKVYPLLDALELVKKTSNTNFTAAVEAHFNLNKKLNLKKAENLKFEKKAPLAHGKVGKVDQKTTELKEVLEKMIKMIGAGNIAKLTLSSSMGPGVKVEV